MTGEGWILPPSENNVTVEEGDDRNLVNKKGITP